MDIKETINRIKSLNTNYEYDPSILENNIKQLIENADMIRQSDTNYPELKKILLDILEDDLSNMQRYLFYREDIQEYIKELKEIGIHDYFINKIHKI